jgi:tetrahydromethanopterin S-methyltransferase subunit B
LNNSEDINEIKLSLEELRNSTSVKFELDAQSEKIDTMESKLNVIIESLEPTFQHQNERMLNLERKVNRIVDFFEPAFTKQQERINKLESMLDKILDVVSSDNGFDNALDRLDRISEIVESKDDTQLVKKLTSFEKQITKLNKTVEKLTNAN